MRFRGALAAVTTAVLAVAGVMVSTPAQAATGTTVTPGVVTGSGLGFDACQAPSTAMLRAWTGSPYRAVNMYFSGTQRGCPNQPLLTADWVTTVLSNGWSLIPTVVDLQAPCFVPDPKHPKQRMSSVAATAQSQAIDTASQAHSDLAALGLAGSIAYLDLENFDTSPGRNCSTVVKTFVAAYTHRLHNLGDKAGVYFNANHGATTIAPMYGHADAPDDVWVANWNGVATPGDASIGSKWPHHRIHQYFSDSTSETYGGEAINVDRDAIDGDVVTAKSVQVSGYNVSSAPVAVLKERLQPNTNQPSPSNIQDKDPIDITCQASGQSIDGDIVWDKLSNNLYVSDLYTTTTGRNSFSNMIPRCDTTPPTLSTSAQPSVTVGPAATIRWSAADQPDSGQTAGETRGISGTTVRYRFATWNAGFSTWRTLTTTTASSAVLPLTVGYAYCVQVQTRDLSGNPSPWSAQSCTTRPLDDRNLTASSGWTRKSSNNYYKLTFTKTWGSGKSLSIANTRARSIGVLAATCSTCGVVKVFIGNQFVGRVNLQASRTHYKQLFMLKPFAIRSGTVKLVTKGTQLVQIDGVVISRL